MRYFFFPCIFFDFFMYFTKLNRFLDHYMPPLQGSMGVGGTVFYRQNAPLGLVNYVTKNALPFISFLNHEADRQTPDF